MCNFGRGHHEEQFCEIILNLDQWFNSCHLELWQPLCSIERYHIRNFGSGHHELQFCEIILNSDQWFRRCPLRDFLSRALAVLLFREADPFMQFW